MDNLKVSNEEVKQEVLECMKVLNLIVEGRLLIALLFKYKAYISKICFTRSTSSFVASGTSFNSYFNPKFSHLYFPKL